MAINSLLIQALVFLLVTGLVILWGLVSSRREERIGRRIQGLKTDGAASGAASALGAGETASQRKERASDRRYDAQMKSRLQDASSHSLLAVAAFIATSAALAMMGAVVSALAMNYFGISWTRGLLVSVPMAIVGGGLPHVWIENRKAHRQLVIRKAVPDFLDLVVACLGGGLSIQGSLRQVADELRLAHPELSAELNIALHELELGSSLDRALLQMALRTGVEELKTLRSFIQQTVKFGTTITDALTQMSEILRVQREQRAEELAQKAAVKILFPTMLFIFPTIFIVLAGPAAVEIKEGFVGGKKKSAAVQLD